MTRTNLAKRTCLTGALFSMSVLMAVTASAVEPEAKPDAEAHAAILATVSRLTPNAKKLADEIQIRPSPVAGVSEVVLGMSVLYISDDGAYAFGGPLIATDKPTNLTEQRLAVARSEVLADTGKLKIFHYPATDVKHKITVFTDIDCPYCRRMHTEMSDFQNAGIDVSYVMLPRAGVGSPSYIKTVNAACADNPEAAITAAMNGTEPATASCKHPIDEHMALAQQLNIGSTPSIVLEDGTMVLGYQKPDSLLKMLENR